MNSRFYFKNRLRKKYQIPLRISLYPTISTSLLIKKRSLILAEGLDILKFKSGIFFLSGGTLRFASNRKYFIFMGLRPAIPAATKSASTGLSEKTIKPRSTGSPWIGPLPCIPLKPSKILISGLTIRLTLQKLLISKSHTAIRKKAQVLENTFSMQSGTGWLHQRAKTVFPSGTTQQLLIKYGP